MKTPCCCISVVHQHGRRKMLSTSETYFGFLGERSSVRNISTFTPAKVSTSKRVQNHKIKIHFFTNSIKALCHGPAP